MLGALCFVVAFAPETIQVNTTAQVHYAITNAKPGQTIKIAPGNYQGGMLFQNLHGTENSFITITAQDPDNPPKFRGGGSALQFSQVSYLEISNIVIERPEHNGLNIDDGGSVETPSKRVVLKGIKVTDTPRGNNDAIKLSGIDGFTVENCTTERWGGSGIDMVGCNNGIIDRCTFQDGGDSGIQAKGGSSKITIQNCRFINAGQRALNLGGSTGAPYFRPALAKMPANGKYEAKELTVGRNVFVGSMSPIAFVGVDGAVVSFNTIYMPERWAIRILQESNGAEFIKCRNGVFTDNIVVFHSSKWASGGVNIGPGTSPETFKFERNFWYCSDQPQNSRPSLPTREAEGTYGTDPLFNNAAQHDFRLHPNSKAVNAGATAKRESKDSIASATND